ASEGMRDNAGTAQLMTLLMFPCTVSILLALQQCADYSIDLKQISMCSVGHAVGREIKSHYVEANVNALERLTQDLLDQGFQVVPFDVPGHGVAKVSTRKP